MNTESDPIVCRVTPWYHKRRVAMMVLLFGFSAYFFYDWKIGYPQERDAAVRLKELQEQKREADYAAEAAAKGWKAKPDLGKNWDYAITEQLVCALLAAAGGVLMLVFYIRTVRGSLRADATSFTTVNGQHVPFASAFRIDRRKWDHKGLAYVYYKDEKGSEKRAVIDDLIFGGAARVLERLEANFKGEVIDLEKKEPPAAEPAGSSDKEKEASPVQ
jgi:hypothetical protein